MTVDKKKSDLILNELKRRKAGEKIIEVEEQKVKIVIFALAGDYYAFYGEDVKEILHRSTIYYVPGSPDFILGVINIRGDIESVININKFLKLRDPEISDKSRVAVVSKDGIRSGVLVDSVEEVQDVPASLIKPPLSTLGKATGDFVAGELIYNNKNITLLNIGKIFAEITV